MKCRLLIGFAPALAWGTARGQTPPLDAYRRGEIEMRPSTGGFSPVVLRQAGVELEVGLVGGNAQAIFDGSPRALVAMDEFRNKRTLGVTLWAVGLTALLVDVVLITSGSSLVWEDESGMLGLGPTYWGLLLGGGLSGVVGGFLIQGANHDLGAAVDAYNEDLYLRLRGDPPSGPTARGLRWTGHF